jgi:hypothetical protein
MRNNFALSRINIKRSIMSITVYHRGHNPFVRALTKIERYATFKNKFEEGYWGWSENPLLVDVKRARDGAVDFLINEGLMDNSGALLPYFSTECTNPLIADAACYVVEVFGPYVKAENSFEAKYFREKKFE